MDDRREVGPPNQAQRGQRVRALVHTAQIRFPDQRGWSPSQRRAAGSGRSAGSGSIEIEFAAEASMRITGAVDAATLKAVVARVVEGRLSQGSAAGLGAR